MVSEKFESQKLLKNFYLFCKRKKVNIEILLITACNSRPDSKTNQWKAGFISGLVQCPQACTKIKVTAGQFSNWDEIIFNLSAHFTLICGFCFHFYRDFMTTTWRDVFFFFLDQNCCCETNFFYRMMITEFTWTDEARENVTSELKNACLTMQSP